MRADKPAGGSANGVTVGYEAESWQIARRPARQHVVLGPAFLKYVSDAFEEQRSKLVAHETKGADSEDPDVCRARDTLWVSRYSRLHSLP